MGLEPTLVAWKARVLPVTPVLRMPPSFRGVNSVAFGDLVPLAGIEPALQQHPLVFQLMQRHIIASCGRAMDNPAAGLLVFPSRHRTTRGGAPLLRGVVDHLGIEPRPDRYERSARTLGPVIHKGRGRGLPAIRKRVEEADGFEPPTIGLTVRSSTRLSYTSRSPVFSGSRSPVATGEAPAHTSGYAAWLLRRVPTVSLSSYVRLARKGATLPYRGNPGLEPGTLQL